MDIMDDYARTFGVGSDEVDDWMVEHTDLAPDEIEEVLDHALHGEFNTDWVENIKAAIDDLGYDYF
jgi:hypothetical protein